MNNPYQAPESEPTSPPIPVTATAIPPEQVDLGGGKLVPYAQAESMVKGSANWYFWIAGLSALNFIMMASGSDTSMVVGLGIPMVVQGLSQGMDATGHVISGTSLAQVLTCGTMISLFAWFGVQGRKIKRWPFVVGMLLYAIDSLVYVLGQLWLAVGFHVFVLFCLFVGWRTIGRITSSLRAKSIG